MTEVAELDRTMTELGRTRPELGRTRPELGRTMPELGRLGRNLAAYIRFLHLAVKTFGHNQRTTIR